MKICPKCDKSHNKKGTYCSRSCANSRTWSEEDKLKKSIAAKNSVKAKDANKNRRIERVSRSCVVCNTQFLVLPKSTKKCCSRKCIYKYLSEKNKGKTGGYREGSGRSISGYYNDIYCGSTYELVWVMYNIHHNIKFNRFEGYIIYNKNKKYYPDFVLEDGTIVEIKGYYTSTVDDKCEAAKNQNYNVNVLYKEDLKYAFEWFKKEYPGKKLKEMYQDYKPKYTYSCTHCGESIETDKKKNTENKFCSRRCSILHNRKSRW